MGRFRKTGFVILALVLLALGMLFRSFLFDNIILPIAVLFWTVWRFFLSVDQNTYWFILIIVCFFLMIRFLRLPGKPAPRPAYGYQLYPVNRVGRWQALIDTSFLHGNDDTKLREGLKELVISSLATIHQTDLRSMEERILKEQYLLPPEIRQYLFSSQASHGMAAANKPLQFWRVRGLLKRKNPFSPGERAPVEEVIQWIEKFLEISHD